MPIRRHSGFTLVELAVVVAIIASISAAGMVMGRSMIDSAKRTQTQNKMDVIEDAFMRWRTGNGRLPCPADPRLNSSDSNYGIEAANPGSCTGGTPAVPFSDSTNFVVEGAVPFATLGLPEEFMYDGWGRKFAYAVSQPITASSIYGVDAFSYAPPSEVCGGITVLNDGGNNRTTGGLYTLVSFGANGHGGYQKAKTGSATRLSAGSTNSDEQRNCHCDSAAAATAYSARYSQKQETLDPTSSTNSFDDFVRFKERWQMMRRQDYWTTVYDGPEVGVAHTTTPYMSIYLHSCDAFTPVISSADTSKVVADGSGNTIPKGDGYGIAISKSDTYMAVAHTTSPYVSIYKRSGTTFTKLSDPGTLPGGDGKGVAFSTDSSDTYLAVAHAGGSFITIYKNSSGTFTKLTSNAPDTAPTAQANSVAFSSSNTYLAVAYSAAPYVAVYKYSATDKFLKVTVATAPQNQVAAKQPQGTGTGVAFSPAFVVGGVTYMYLAVAHATTPFITIYKINTTDDSFTVVSSSSDHTKMLADAGGASIPAGNAQSVAFSSDNTHMIVGHATSPYISVYKMNTSADTFTKITDPSSLPGSTGNGVAFSWDTRYIGVAAANDPYLVLYRFNAASDTFTRLATPATKPASTGNGIAFRN